MWKCLVPVALLVAAAPAFAAEQPKVDAAVKKAAEFFKKRVAQGIAGPQNFVHGNGELSLMGLAMLEAGVPPADPAMKAVIQQIRGDALAQTQTYPVALAVLFLDRLGDPADVPVIQMLGVRLYAGMNANGGWGYSTWEEMNGNELARLQKALQDRELIGQPGEPGPGGKPDAPKPPARAGKLHSEVEKVATAVGQALRARGRSNGGDDNSNTQFGILAVWMARKHGVPTDAALDAIERRFLSTQNATGGWSYSVGSSTGSPSMTCCGLLGLATAVGRREERRLKVVAPLAPPKEAVAAKTGV